jgi:hypothetical protein
VIALERDVVSHKERQVIASILTRGIAGEEGAGKVFSRTGADTGLRMWRRPTGAGLVSRQGVR